MSTIPRTLRNLFRIGIKDYGHQMQYMGDTKAGTLIGTDRFGNKYFENLTELPLRTRWVDYKEKFFEPSQIEPGWHAWISYAVDTPPSTDPLLCRSAARPWEPTEHKPTLTWARAAFRTYNTARPKYSSWEAVAKARD